MLDEGMLPVADLARLAAREGKRPRAYYGAHKWFARRAASAFRALLVASALPPDGDFWAGYYGGVDLCGRTVLDPFVGGGTSVVEARRLGADVIGVDVDPVACAITSFETRQEPAGELQSGLSHLRKLVGGPLSDLYRTAGPDGAEREVLHFFWVQVVDCRECGHRVEGHPHFQLAHDGAQERQWVFCRDCHAPHSLDLAADRFECSHCEAETVVANGTVDYGRLTCPSCGAGERLIDVAQRTGTPPRFNLFAMEVLPVDWDGTSRVHIAQRTFQAATPADRDRALIAEQRLGALDVLAGLDDSVPLDGRTDDRLVRYGYRRYRDLFNPRQLLHVQQLAAALDELPTDAAREALILAFSDHLATNCMLTCYAFGWRRLVPLFAVRAFRHIPRPVEINPWLDGIGRGTFPNAVRQVERAVKSLTVPQEMTLDGKARTVAAPAPGRSQVLHTSASDLSRLADASVDLVLTDPPYLDNIDYSELADFYVPWLRSLGIADEAGPSRLDSLAAVGRNQGHADAFATALGAAFSEVARVLRVGGRVVFTFRHSTETGWKALGHAVGAVPSLRCLQVFPLLAEGTNKLHTHEGSAVWDAVFVLERRPDSDCSHVVDGEVYEAAATHAAAWRERLSHAEPVPFRDADSAAFEHACRVAADLGAFDRRAGVAVGSA